MLTEALISVSTEPDVKLYTVRTDGPTDRVLLAVHGGPDWDHTYLRDPLLQLAGRHRVLLPDLRGCGRSTRGLPDAEYTWDAVVSDLLALLDAENVAEADLLGFSTGGLIAQRLVLAAPHRFRRLVVASSSVLPVPDDAFADWPEYEARHQEGRDNGPDLAGLAGAALNRAQALITAPANLWRKELLPEYLRRLDEIHWSGEWLRIWEAGLTGSPRAQRSGTPRRQWHPHPAAARSIRHALPGRPRPRSGRPEPGGARRRPGRGEPSRAHRPARAVAGGSVGVPDLT